MHIFLQAILHINFINLKLHATLINSEPKTRIFESSVGGHTCPPTLTHTLNQSYSEMNVCGSNSL